MARYHFVTTFDVAASRERAWEVLSDLAAWPSWWGWLRRLEVLAPGGPDGVGARYRCCLRTALAYPLTFEGEVRRAERPSFIELGVAGELAGAGLWQLADVEGGSRMRYTWVVDTTKRWMNLLAPLAGPAFAWNHHLVMRDFAAGFASQLGTGAPAVDNRRVKPSSPQFGVLPGPAAP